MSTLEALKAEIETAPEPLLKEVFDFMSRKKREAAEKRSAAPSRWPDFAARQQAVFGDTVTPDSQEIMDALREDRV